MGIRVGIDTGGTFTDLVAVDDDGRAFFAKVPSNPADPVATVAAALGGASGSIRARSNRSSSERRSASTPSSPAAEPGFSI